MIFKKKWKKKFLKKINKMILKKNKQKQNNFEKKWPNVLVQN